MATYKVIFLGLFVAGPEEEARLTKGLQKKFNLSPEKAEKLLQRVPIVVKKGILKEEMEKYIKAFDEIGGRVKVEEEPMLDSLELIPESKVGERDDTGRMMVCPQCGFEQPEKEECIKCGVIISKYLKFQEMTQSVEGQVRQVREILPEEEFPPWESEGGILGAFLQNAQESLFSPTQFFKKAGHGEGYWSPLIYGVICGIIGIGGTMLWAWLFSPKLFTDQRFSAVPLVSLLVIIAITLPFVLAFSLLIGSCVIHICLMIVGGNKKGFQATFRAISYSYSGYLFGIIPFIGGTIGGIYTLILSIFGLREGHVISTGKAILAIFLPLIVMVVLGILAAILFSLFIGSIGVFKGVGV